MEINMNGMQRRKLLNPGAGTQLKEVPEGPFPLDEEEDFHLSLYDSLECDSDSLIQERQYQLELQHHIQDNEEMVTLEDSEFGAENGQEEGWNVYNSLEETEAEDEQDRGKTEPENKNNDITRQQCSGSDRYANLRYNPDWRKTRTGAEILMPKQKHNSHINDSLGNLLQESNELLEKTVSRYHDYEHQDISEQKMQTSKDHGVIFSLRENDNNVGKQPKRKRPPSPYNKYETSTQEEQDSHRSPGFYNETIMSNFQNHRITRTDKITEGVPQHNHGRNTCHTEDDCEKFDNSEYEHLDLLKQKRQTDKPQDVKFSLRESDNVEKQPERKRLPSDCKSEGSTQDCESVDSPRFYTDTIQSNLQNDRKTRTDKITEKVPKDNQENNKDSNEDHDYENLNDQYQKEYQQFLERESTCSDMSTHSMKHSKNPMIPCDRKLQPKGRLQDDVVERNKQTLGKHKITSYQQLYSEKEEVKVTQQNQKAKQLAMRKNGVTNVRERPPRPPIKPGTKQQIQKSQLHEEQTQRFENEVHQNKNASELLTVQKDDNSVLLTPSSDRTFTSSVNQLGPTFIPNSHSTVNLNINVNTSSSDSNTQTTVKLVPSHHPMSQAASVYRDHNVYSTSQPQKPVSHYQVYQKYPEPRNLCYPYKLNTDPSHFSTTLCVPENAPNQPLGDIQAPSYTQFGQTQHGPILNPNYQQAAYSRTLAPALYNYSHFQGSDTSAGNSLFYSMNQEKMEDNQNQIGKEYGNARFSNFPFLPSYQQYLIQSPSTRLIQQMEHIYESTPRLAYTHPSSHLVLPPIGLMAESDSELDQTQPNEKRALTITRCNSDGYLAQMEKINKLKEKNAYKPYTLRDYKSLKQDVKLGGLGPDYNSAQEKAEKMKRQKEYAKQVKDQNLKVDSKSSNSLPKTSASIENKAATSSRKLALEYARNIHRPKPQATKPRNANEKSETGEFPEYGQYAQLDPSHNILLAMMQQRHDKEKQIVAGFKAMHVS
ncbi:jhy protein homolog isoform X2 [Scyliorhinus canicula]|uniref:jhy protein homolog isoform X2 n=1 Tax=Scyliorhinus canicula TaxID=7830 RepID=UPI0018F5A6D6|nr:jhy protein homolog isoform X2 [Scyliorhinus canicula]